MQLTDRGLLEQHLTGHSTRTVSGGRFGRSETAGDELDDTIGQRQHPVVVRGDHDDALARRQSNGAAAAPPRPG